jgi:hypothetical protein
MIQPRSHLQPIIPRLFALLLLVISLVSGLFELIICNRILMFPLFLLLGTSTFYHPIYIASWFLLGFGYLVFLVLTSEYHFKHLGKPESWILLVKTFGVQLLILVFSFFV